jgi:hypothetical protein
MMEEEESPFAFHEGGARETYKDENGIPRNRFNRREGKMRKTFSQENNEKDEFA